DTIEEVGRAGGRGQPVDERAHAGRLGLRRLVAHIDGARRIVAGEHHGEPRHDAATLAQPPRRRGDLLAQGGCDRGPVNEAGGHAALSSRGALPAACSSAAASDRASPAMVTRFTRAVAPPTMATRPTGTPAALAMRRTSASFAAPSCGAARTRALSTARPSASAAM